MSFHKFCRAAAQVRMVPDCLNGYQGWFSCDNSELVCKETVPGTQEIHEELVHIEIRAFWPVSTEEKTTK